MLGRFLGSRPYARVGEQTPRAELKRRAPVGLIVAATLSVLLCFFQLFLVFFQVILSDADKFDNNTRAAYTTGISILATLLAFVITSNIRNASIRWLDYRLATEPPSSRRNIDSAWRASLGFMGFKEGVTTVSQWPTHLLYIFTGLLAAAFISATTPADALATSSYSPWIPKGSDCSCAGTIPKNPGDGQPNGWAAGDATWSVSDSASFAATNRTDSFRCALSQMPGLMNAVNSQAADKMAYSVDGIAVQGSALGAPEVLFSSFYNPNVTSAFRAVIAGKGGDNLHSVSQCAPVLKKNPFKCARDPNGKTEIDQVGQSAFGSFVVQTDGCAYSKWYNGDLLNGTLAQLMSGQFCAGSAVGAGTLVIGGYQNAAVNLALMVGDLDWAEQNWQNAAGYTVRCSVDVAAAIGWREVTLQLQSGLTAAAPYAQVVSGGADCDSQPLDPAYAATAAGVAGKAITDENEDLYFPKTLLSKALNATGNHPSMYKADPIAPSDGMVRRAPFAFADSANGLEDALGVTAGIVMSKMIAQNFTGNEDAGTVARASADGKTHTFSSGSGEAALPTLTLTGSATTRAVRMGVGETFAVVYAVPALLAALAAGFLLVRVPWHREPRRASSLLDIMAMAGSGETLQMQGPAEGVRGPSVVQDRARGDPRTVSGVGYGAFSGVRTSYKGEEEEEEEEEAREPAKPQLNSRGDIGVRSDDYRLH